MKTVKDKETEFRAFERIGKCLKYKRRIDGFLYANVPLDAD